MEYNPGSATPHYLVTQSEGPEDFYRAPLPSLRTDNDSLFDNSSTSSPTDSDVPMMASTKASSAHEYVPSPISPEDHAPVYPLPPSIPIADHYGGTTTIVNGEIGAASLPPPDTRHGDTQYATYPIAPLSAGLKTAGTQEEQRVIELEEKVHREDKRDLAVKLKVRLAKVVLRGVNCACSTVVLALVASTFQIFNATRHLLPRNNLPPWSQTTPTWPQITILVISSMSLMLSLYIMYGYWSGGHSKAERIAAPAGIFAGAAFVFGLAIWAAGIAIMKGSRGNNSDQDLWGWACKNNVRKKLFQDTINYDLVCRQQNWVIVCAIIEICAEVLTMSVYAFAIYRITYSKRRLRKSMNVRNEARSSVWMVKLKEQKQQEESDPETYKNTAYNQNSSMPYIEAEEGRAVPILQAPPPGLHAKIQQETDAMETPLTPPLTPPQMPAAAEHDFPASPKSVSFQAPPHSGER